MAEGDPLNGQIQVEDPQIGEIRTHVADLKNAVESLHSLITTAQLPAVTSEDCY